MELSEKELIARAKGGDRQAFNTLVRLNKDKMFALIYRMTGDREAALDLMQDTFLAAYMKLSGFRETAVFSSWLYRIASNKTLNYLRRKKLVSFLPFGEKGVPDIGYETENKVVSSELNTEIKKAVEELPPKQKLVFNLRFYQQLPFGEIAAILSRSESSVKTNYRKAIEKLRKRLKNFR
jgi:RNA polymerase sigma-70 factor (ECF subfamily)